MIIESMLGLALSLPADPSLKCPPTHHLPGFPEKSGVVLIDGEIRGSNLDFPPDDFDATDIAKIDIKCWNPNSDELPASSGIQLILITTKSTIAKAEAATLEAARLVHAFVAENDEIPASADQVHSSLAGYSIEAREFGWVLTSAEINGIECVTSQLGSNAEEVQCSNTYSVAKQALRDAWERGAQAF